MTKIITVTIEPTHCSAVYQQLLALPLLSHDGIRSRVIGRFHKSQGFSKIINLSGGVAAWVSDIDRKMATY